VTLAQIPSRNDSLTTIGMATNRAYEALPLDRSSQSVRLLRLHENQKAGLLKFELSSFPLTSAPPFTALSYTWGDARSTKEIRINGNRFIIRENLWQFLAELRRKQHHLFYWIDAICIDQSSADEKNHQVSLMKDIYSLVRLPSL
jgi:hypothetical protein